MMRRMFKLPVIIMVMVAAPTALAQYDVSWSSIDGGGGMSSTGGGYVLAGTIGQPDAMPGTGAMSGGAFQITGGFWTVTQVCVCYGDLNGDGQKNGRDVQQFVGCIISGGNCSCADVDLVNGITLDDVPVFVTGLLAGPTCP